MDTQNSYLASKPHYEILDGLRGVASVMVVAFHLLEAHSGGSHLEHLINHGYLAVDFFFMLSGFVIGYAYDDRWNRMSVGTFFKRRIIRLHPMVIVGSIIGAVFFYFQESPCFPAIQNTSVGTMLLVMLLGCTLLPLPLKWDIRGWTEMHPLNGPAWSLYYEYIGNILYALFIRKFNKTALSVFGFGGGMFYGAPLPNCTYGRYCRWLGIELGAAICRACPDDISFLWRIAVIPFRMVGSY